VRGLTRALAAFAIVGATLALGSHAAGADPRVEEPTDDPVVVEVADDGWPAAVTVTVSGWEPYQSVYIEQCNGRTPEDDDWSPALDCDPGSAPAAAVADDAGVATFRADDPNHALRPFVGASPQRLFNCLGPDAPSPDNEIDADFRDCQIRVSSNNTRSTSDQVFLRLELPNKAKEWSPEIVPGAVVQSTPADGDGAGTGSAATDGTSAGASDARAASATTTNEADSDGSNLPVVVTLIVVAGVLGVGTALLVRRHRNRNRHVAA
jgi:hypothetical protein